MAVYRVLRRLSSGERVGILTTLARLPMGSIVILAGRGAIARINAPILEILSGWSERAEVLHEVGIVDGEQLLLAEPGMLAVAVGETVEMVRAWQAEMVALLTIAQDDGCGC